MELRLEDFDCQFSIISKFNTQKNVFLSSYDMPDTVLVTDLEDVLVHKLSELTV